MTVSVDILKDPTIKLKARRTLDGKVMIFDHEDIDIVLSMESKKCVTFPKQQTSDKAYQAQDRMFDYLIRRGCMALQGALMGLCITTPLLEKTNKRKNESNILFPCLRRPNSNSCIR